MQITQIIQGVHNPSAGPTYSVAKLADELYKSNLNASILTLGKQPEKWPYQAKLNIYSGWIERHIGISFNLIKELRKHALQPGILHGHGIWRITNLFPLLIPKNSPTKIICSPRGTLSEWSMKYKSTVKMPFWKLLQKPALLHCHCFHATSKAEYEDIRRVGLHGPVALIPNGIDIPEIPPSKPHKKQVVFLSRINPIKGLDILLPAWKAISSNFNDWELVIAGPLNNNYAQSVQARAHRLKIPRIKFVDEVLDQEKNKLLSEASLFVLPSYSENFGMAVVEALAHGTPVITTTGTPWTKLKEKKCGWCINPDQNALEYALQEAMSQPPELLKEMGRNGRHWMQTDYSWQHVTKMMQQTYEWLLSDTPKPDWIIEE
ncbi:MAG: glycosyltransferase [Gammaproteobacteria bacterium]|nr:glycosyltransferase [Gammaproteobacteria bacterium]MCW8923427.1 glycosyltransferase [Gammaproteobacteria bacterium]